MKKISLLLVLALLLGLTACGPKAPEAETPPEEAGPLRLETLKVEISRGGLGTEQLAKAVKELPEALQTALAAAGAEVGELTVTVGSSSSATAQALAEGHVDLAFLPAEAALRDGAAAILLADAQRPQPDGELREPGASALLRAGASPYGGQLSARSAGDAPLTWEELKNARWGVSETGAAAACFDLWLSANFDSARMAELPQVTLYPDDAALLDDALLGEVDALVICREPWAQTAEVDAEEALPLLAETEPLCTRLAAVSPAREELAGDAFAAALEQAMRQLEGERPELMEALGAARFTAVEEEDLDSARRFLALEDAAP